MNSDDNKNITSFEELANKVNEEIANENKEEVSNELEATKVYNQEELNQIQNETKSDLDAQVDSIVQEAVEGLNDIENPKTEVDTNDETGFEDVNKKGFFAKFWWIFVLILLLGGGAYYYFFIYNKQTEKPVKEEPKKVVELVTIPTDAKVKDYYEGLSNFNFVCFDSNGIAITTVRAGSEITCYLEYNIYNSDDFKFNEYYFNLEYGKGLTMSYKIDSSNKAVVKNENNDYKVTLNDYITSSELGDIAFSFKITDDTEISNTDLYIKISNLYFKTKDNTYYKINSEINKTLPFQSNKYYIYYEDELLKVSSKVESGLNLLYTYQCSSKDCTYIDDDGERYILFNDNGMTLFDLSTKTEKPLTYLKNDYSYYYFVTNTNNKIQSIIAVGHGDESYEALYSVINNKYIINDDVGNDIFYSDNYIIAYDENDNYTLYNLDGSKFQYTTNTFERVENSNYYVFYVEYENGYILINSNNKKYNNGELVGLFGLDNENNIIIGEEDYFKIYDENFNLTYTSDKYDEVISIHSGIVYAMNEDKFISINSNDKTTTTIKEIVTGSKYDYSYTSDDGSVITLIVYDPASKSIVDGDEMYTYYMYKFDSKTNNLVIDTWKDYNY